MTPHRILVATPHSETASLLLGWFAKNGFYVGLVSDVSELGDASKLPVAPECLLLDEALGSSLLVPVVKCVRSDERWQKTVVVAMGNFSEELEVELLRSGADDVVVKPMRGLALVERFKRFLNVRT